MNGSSGRTITLGAGAHNVAVAVEADDAVRALDATVADVTDPERPLADRPTAAVRSSGGAFAMGSRSLWVHRAGTRSVAPSPEFQAIADIEELKY